MVCERYVAGEPGETYSIEATLGAGYDFEGIESVCASVSHAGLDEIIAAEYFYESERDGDRKLIVVIDSANALISVDKD